MYKIAVLGDRDSVMGFKALGLDTFFVEEAEEARHTLHRVAKEEYAIVYVTEQLAQLIPADIARYKTETTPAVILIPGKTGSLGLGAQALQTAIERAVGADIG
ncbi:MAG: V-type ATP synthase subunit F [Oscillospiraceae bacterium]|nr:V-type ATP synthase subunit F [Oscillospiraceae bacterium]